MSNVLSKNIELSECNNNLNLFTYNKTYFLTPHEADVLTAILIARKCFVDNYVFYFEPRKNISRSDGMFQYYAPVRSENIASTTEFEDFETACFFCCSTIKRPMYFAAQVMAETVFCCKTCFVKSLNNTGKTKFKYVLTPCVSGTREDQE